MKPKSMRYCKIKFMKKLFFFFVYSSLSINDSIKKRTDQIYIISTTIPKEVLIFLNNFIIIEKIKILLDPHCYMKGLDKK